MTNVRIVSLNVGKPKIVQLNGKEVTTGFYKEAVGEQLSLSKLNFDGDGQAEAYHGGVDKAVCVYPYEHYAYWEQELNRKLSSAAFGENLTVTGMLETEVHIGDIFQIGQAVVQITQPRRPCYKISGRHDVKNLTLQVQNSGYTGFYLRVLEEGNIGPDSKIERLLQHPAQVTVAFANEHMYHSLDNIEAIQQILAVDALSESWYIKFTKHLEKRTTGI